MLAIQKPAAFFQTAPAHRPSHSRHPSAPVLIRPTQTPGLLSLSKPAQPHQPRPQQSQPHPRAPKAAQKSKQQRSPQPAPAQAHPVDTDRKPSAPKPRSASPTRKTSKPSSAPSPEKSTRGRQSAKPSPKEKTDGRTPSLSRPHARRPSHQPSPPPPVRIPDEPSSRPSVNPFRAQSYNHRDSDSNLFDPFVQSTSDNESPTPTPSKNATKPLSFRSAPQLDSRPSGKLANRRQPTAHHATGLSKSTPVTPPRTAGRRKATGLPLAEWDEFPICDDMTVVSSPTTPVRETSSVPPKPTSATWQQSLFPEGPHTAPLSSTFAYPFASSDAFSTPTPASRRRHHRRIPSEGMFAMSADEDSSDSSDELKQAISKLQLFGNARVGPTVPRTPSPPAMDGMPAGFYAGSVFQNSPSPDELPVPAFRK